MTILIRYANPSDTTFILHGNQIVDERSYANTIVPHPLTVDRLKNEIFNDKPKAYIMVAEFENQRAGFVIYSYCFFASEGEGIWITNLYIDPFCRKKGIGIALLEEIKKQNPSTSGIYGSIARTNTIARHFFSNLNATRYDDYIIYGVENDWGKVE